MSERGDDKLNGWTVDTLRIYLFRLLDERDKRYAERFLDLEKALQVALQGSQKAIDKAENATERRFAAVNEFRQTLSDQATQFVVRKEADAQSARLTDRLVDLDKRITRAEGRGSGLQSSWGYLLGAVTLVMTILTIYLALRGG